MTTVTLEEDLLEGLAQFMAVRDAAPNGKMTNDDAVNVIVRDWLMAQGYIPLPGSPDDIRPALEAAHVPEAQQSPLR